MGACLRDVPAKLDAAEESANMLWIRAAAAPEARAEMVTRRWRCQPASSTMTHPRWGWDSSCVGPGDQVLAFTFSSCSFATTSFPETPLTPRRDGEQAGDAVEDGGGRHRRCRRRGAEGDAGGPAEGGSRERRGLESYRHRRLGVGGASRGSSRPVRTRAGARGRQEDVLVPERALEARRDEEEARRGGGRRSSRSDGRYPVRRGGPGRKLRRRRRRRRRDVGRHRDLAGTGDVHHAHRGRVSGRASQKRGGAS